MDIVKKKNIDERMISNMLSIVDNYTDNIIQFVSFLRQLNYDLTYKSIEEYIEYMREKKGYSTKTINRHISAIKHRIKELSKNITDVTKLYKINYELKKLKYGKTDDRIKSEKIISEDEVQYLIDNAKEDVSLFIRFLYHTGLRVSEMINIKLFNIKEYPDYYNVRILGKGSKERFVKCQKSLINEIKNYFKGREFLFEIAGKQYSRSSVTHKIMFISKQLFGKQISAHTLRHCFATHKLKQTKNTKGVSSYLGHSSTATTLNMYVHSELSLEDLDIK